MQKFMLVQLHHGKDWSKQGLQGPFGLNHFLIHPQSITQGSEFFNNNFHLTKESFCIGQF